MCKGYPEFAFYLWASGAGDIQCAEDMDLPIPKWQRVFWNIRGSVLCFLFGWWWWVKDTRAQHRVQRIAFGAFSAGVLVGIVIALIVVSYQIGVH